MSSEELNQLAERLRLEIDALQTPEPEALARLNALHTELETRLAHPREDNQDADFIESMRESIERFEVSHPRATGILAQILQTLGNMGI